MGHRLQFLGLISGGERPQFGALDGRQCADHHVRCHRIARGDGGRMRWCSPEHDNKECEHSEKDRLFIARVNALMVLRLFAGLVRFGRG